MDISNVHISREEPGAWTYTTLWLYIGPGSLRPSRIDYVNNTCESIVDNAFPCQVIKARSVGPELNLRNNHFKNCTGTWEVLQVESENPNLFVDGLYFENIDVSNKRMFYVTPVENTIMKNVVFENIDISHLTIGQSLFLFEDETSDGPPTI